MLLRSHRTALALSLLTLPLGACSCSGGGDGTTDGGLRREQPPEGGPEGGLDGARGFDAGAANGSADAGRDDARAPRDAHTRPDAGAAGWTPLPGLPDGCRIERAEHPEVLFTPEWIPCGDGFDGCSKLAPDPSYRRALDPQVGYHDGTQGYFRIVQSLRSDPERRRIVSLAQTDGAPVAAWRGPRLGSGELCAIGPTAVDHGAAALILWIESEEWGSQQRVFHAPLEEIGTVEEPVTEFELSEVGGTVQNLAVSETTVGLEVQPGGAVVVVEEGRYRRLDNLPDRLAGTPQRVQTVGRHILWSEWGSRIRPAHASMSDETTLYYEPPDGADALAFTTDGARIGWALGFGTRGSYERVELWTASYERDPADLSPAKVSDLPRHVAKATVGAGYFAHRNFDGWHQIVLRRLSDGRVRRWTLPSEHSARGTPLWITEEEFAVPAGGGTLFRVQLDSVPFEE